MNLHTKKQYLLTALILFMGCSPLFATEMTMGEKSARIPELMTRGVLAAVYTPYELIRTPTNERKEHPRLWPVTSVPRTITNIAYRLTSATYDIAFYPFAAPFVDETPPLTEKMGLSADIFENEDES